MHPETNKIPDWATQERERDLSWIHNNLDIFWQTAIVVDVAIKPMGNDNLFTYIAQVDLARFDDEDIN